MWTFGRKIALGFAVSFVLLLTIGVVAYRSIDLLTQTSYRVNHTYVVLSHLNDLVTELTNIESDSRGFVITGEETHLARMPAQTASVNKNLKELRQLTSDNLNQQQRLDALEPLVMARLANSGRNVEVRREAGMDVAIKLIQAGEGKRLMESVRRTIDEMITEEQQLLRQRAEDVEASASGARTTILLGTVFCLVFVSSAGFLLTRSLGTQITSTVQHVQRSSTELQSAANQQAAGARESSTSMTEITTTINELLASSRQIAESAQRVASVAEQTAVAARNGDGTVQAADTSIAGIRQQVDLVVNHMLELGRKSQQIGSVLDIVSELAEQTNILAINATIEATGAGDAGRRFGVVAEEIRKLADRVSGSTKEIRALIEDVRGAVNTTVMATETGSKAVDAGARQFGEVTTVFRQIAALVATTTEAAREIELSTKQQTTAVEQVNLAISNTAQATRETEASSGQTLQTASQLAGLSRELLRLVQPQTAT